MKRALTWQQLSSLTRYAASDTEALRVNGPTNSHTDLRLFGKPESEVRLTLFRDKHAWCPYCQKIWLWLEEKQIPYRVQKVTMFCYGDKESWYKKKVPSGMLPAIELDGNIVTESDVVLAELEDAFGPLHRSMSDPEVVPLRKLERMLFGSWCQWLCYPSSSRQEELFNSEQFESVVERVELALAATDGPFFLGTFSVADVVFVPYVERMSASLFYYKGYTLRDPQRHPHLAAWFDALEERDTYRGTQSDFHTHCHDLPPQMGGCYQHRTPEQQRCLKMVNSGPWNDLADARFEEPADSCEHALYRVTKHHENIINANPCKDKQKVDEALRCALSHMMHQGQLEAPPKGSDSILGYIKDRVNVPRDMPVHAARRFRTALMEVASMAGEEEGAPIPVRHRRDQDPKMFGR